jgi:hypothetical protein
MPKTYKGGVGQKGPNTPTKLPITGVPPRMG